MRRRRLALLIGCTSLVFLGGCRRQGAPAAGGSRHPLTGKAVAVDVAGRTLTVAHQDVPGFMPAMTMEFVVLEKDAPLLRHVGPGDEVTATLVVADSRYWLEDLTVVKKGTPDPDRKTAIEAHPTQIGAALPDVTLVDQDGRSFRLHELRGRATALTFVYTRCPLPDFCPLMMKNFAAVESALIADPVLRERTRLLTVSFDPKHDTPQVLRGFGLRFQKTSPPFTHWRLASGSEQEIRTLAGALELDYVEETASFTHNLRTAVLDPAGALRRLFRGNEWTPAELVAALRQAAGAPL
jgi:protein SCO1/2